jgi:hypothetical protein
VGRRRRSFQGTAGTSVLAPVSMSALRNTDMLTLNMAT